MLAKEGKEIHFNDFIECITSTMKKKKEVDVVIEEKEDGVFLQFHFYEKKLWIKSEKETLFVVFDRNSGIRFQGDLSKKKLFQQERSIGFLKYQIARAVDDYFEQKTNYGREILKQYYQ